MCNFMTPGSFSTDTLTIQEMRHTNVLTSQQHIIKFDSVDSEKCM
jgi:hypothetical protein